jgi:hypothetical protein
VRNDNEKKKVQEKRKAPQVAKTGCEHSIGFAGWTLRARKMLSRRAMKESRSRPIREATRIRRQPNAPISQSVKALICSPNERGKIPWQKGSIPGHPRSGLAPIEMAWEGKSIGEICTRLKNSKKTNVQ